MYGSIDGDLAMQANTESRVQIDVPEHAFAGDEPLVAVERGQYVSGVHRGVLAVADSHGSNLLSIGDSNQPAFLRSAAKPFQLIPAVLAGAIQRFRISERELAVLCASHWAEPNQLTAVLSVLRKIGLDEGSLRCGVHPPISPAVAEQLVREGRQATAIHNNCSGAHTGMLMACVSRDWPIEKYGSPDHPLQVMTRAIIAGFAGVDIDAVELAVDNCAVPTFRLPISNAARAFARLATGQAVPPDLAEAALEISSAMTRHPEMVGGEGSFDTALMVATSGNLVSKGGAEAFAGIGVRSLGLGFALKITDGNPRAVPPASVDVLRQIGALTENELVALAEYRAPAVLNHQGKLVGRLRPVFSFGESG
jgi:L-asparaginase II